MDSKVAISKVSTAVERLLRDDPKWTGSLRIRMEFRDGRVSKLKKVALRPTLWL